MRRRYSPAVEALHREAWEGAMVEGPDALRAMYAGGGPFPGRLTPGASLVWQAGWLTAQAARRRLAQARRHSGSTEGAATPARAA